MKTLLINISKHEQANNKMNACINITMALITNCVCNNNRIHIKFI